MHIDCGSYAGKLRRRERSRRLNRACALNILSKGRCRESNGSKNTGRCEKFFHRKNEEKK
jgi:hypothetical protein